MDALNLVTVSESAARELTATGARLGVRISGQSFVTGTQAFKKAAEVAACIAAVEKCGVTEDDVRLLDVSMEVESGLLMKSSFATYDLEIKCRSVDALAPIIAAISAQKNSRLFSIAWDYPDLAKAQREVLQEAVRAAHSAAAAIATALGITLLGIHKLSYSAGGLDTDLQIPSMLSQGAFGHVARAKKGVVELSPGLTFSHTTRLVVAVSADFFVGAFANTT
jgi:uncharacterized protein YggE